MKYKDPNECDDGYEFGRLNTQGCRYAKIRNSQMAEYGANLKDVDAQIKACRDKIVALKLQGKIDERQAHEWRNMFNLVNIGRYYACVMLKETSEILLDAGLIEAGSDPWSLGGKAGGR